MSSRRVTTTTTEPPTTVAVKKEPSTSPFIIPLVIVTSLVVIIICIIIIILVYRKRKNSLIKIEPAESEKLSLSGGKKHSSIDSAMKQRVFSIDSERGLSDVDNLNTLKDTSDEERRDDKPGQVTRTSSKTSFKSIAFIARMGTGSNKSDEKQKDNNKSAADENTGTSDSETELDPKAINILQTLTKPNRQKERTRMAKKHIEDQKTKAIFSTAKKLYEGQISTFKRTNGRANSAGTQTSPAGSFISIPGLLESNDSGSEAHYDSPPPRQDKHFFVYLVSDNSTASSTSISFKKDCIGKISLPDHVKSFNLSQLRSYLIQSDDDVLRSVLKNNKSFKFVTETYKSVAQEEKLTYINDVYLNQGIFVKFTDGQFIPCDAKVGGAIVDHKVSRAGGKRRSRRHVHLPPVSMNNDDNNTDDLVTGDRSITPISKIHGKQMTSIHGNDDFSMRVNVNSPIDEMKRDRGHTSPSLFYSNYDEFNYIHPNPDAFKRRALDADFSLDEDKITEKLRKRHIECISPLPLKYKEAYKRQVLLIMDSRRICDRNGCKYRAMFKCARCTMAAYCSAKCKKEHWLDHRLLCRRPPWRA